MADKSDTPRDAFTTALTHFQHNLNQLEDVLKTLWETTGIQPTFHLRQALEKVHESARRSQDNGQALVQQRDQLQELVRTSALITSSLELAQVLKEVMDTVIQLTGAQRGYLMLYDEGNNLQVKAARNWDRQTLTKEEIGFSQSIIDAAIQGGSPIITTNAQADERFQSQASIVIQQLRSIICVPLTMRGKTVGVLYMDNRFRKALFEQDMVPLLTAFGTQAAIAITNARTFGEVQGNLAEAEAEISRLRIEIDRARLETQVGEITSTEYFQKLSERAKSMRQRREKLTQSET
ncbi:MAG: GAF domain-containing protein [Anaerolineae bacterium]|nr:GAF domain-containing protein [Anaerolineae bacterium]